MKSFVQGSLATAFAVFAFVSFAKTYYVDPTGDGVSSDDYDGEAEVWDGAHGPRRTLQGVMALAKKSGDVVIALPGVYNEGAMNQSTYGSNRVVVASGVLLKSRDGAEATTIEGYVSTLADADGNGCGTDSMRCVYLNTGAVLCGFTLTKGRTSTLVSGNNVRVGGGVNGGYCVDCVFSDNASVSGGAHAFSSKLLRCYLGSVPSGSGYPCYLGVHLVNCVYYTEGYAFNNIRAYNTTFVQGFLAASKSAYAAEAYNSVFMGSSASTYTHYYNCRSVVALGSGCTDEGGNEFGVKASELQYEAGTYRPSAGSCAIDKGNVGYCALATNGWTALAQSFVGGDFAGGQRVYNGAIDIGAGEHNPCEEFSAILSAHGAVTVTNATPNVVGKDETLEIGADEAVFATLNKNGDAAMTQWGFFAEVKGDGVLKAYFGDSVNPVEVTKADGKKAIGYAAADETALRVVYEGEDGAAEIGHFVNRTEVTIEAESAGVDISGDITGTGTVLVPTGKTLTFMVARTNETTKYVSGLEVNGEFIDFNDYPNGKTFTVFGDDVFSGVTIKVVYANTREWFVDANGGSNDNCGLYTNMAFKTLAFAASVAKTSGDTITALPGIYNEGAMKQSTYGSNRVVVASGVLLRSRDGAAVTTIEGRVSEEGENGFGPDSLRCAYLNPGAVLCGFTLTNGRSSTLVSGTNIQVGGGVCGGNGNNSGYCVDCVFSANTANQGGRHVFGSRLLRCYLGTVASGGSNYSCYLGTALVDCIHDNASTIRQNARIYNSTLLKGSVSASNASNPGYAYNSVFLGSTASAHTHFKNCRSVAALATANSFDDGENEFEVDEADLQYDDETYRPMVGSHALDKGNAAHYASATNGWTELAQSFVGKDFAGGQRVYNGVIDIGAGEYDWRDTFSRRLARKYVAVEEASSGVTTNAVKGIDLTDGESVAVMCMVRTKGMVSFKVAVTGSGMATVKVGDAILVPTGDVYSFDGTVGEDVVTISFAGDGVATVSDFALPKFGLLLMVR